MKAHVRIIEDQEEEIRDVNPLTEEETKAFLSKNHPDLYKQLYPNEVKPVVATPKKTIPKSSGDIQQTDKEYTYNKYDSMNIGDDTISYKIQIKTDMNF